MDKFVIEGGVPLRGEVLVCGSKNASLPMMAACLLAPGKSVLNRVPDLADIRTMALLLEHLGCTVSYDANSECLSVDTVTLCNLEATYDIVRKMRASTLVLGPLVARFGRGRVSLPGGCAIGSRPIDQHLKGLSAMGAVVQLEHGYVDVTAPPGGLRGAKIHLDMPSVGATEHLMCAATLAIGTTIIENAAREPEITDLARMLTTMGAKISGAGSSRIQIEGVPVLQPADVRVCPDRIEAGTLLAAAAITGGDVLVKDLCAADIEVVLEDFRLAGCQINISEAGDAVHLVAPARLKPVDVKTAPYPGFPTDMQAQWMACMVLADGTSYLEETIFENRFMHALELDRMGAQITIHGSSAVVKGVAQLSGAPVMATDLRASASLVLAALAAQGTTEVLRIYHLDRGYVKLEEKLNQLGARVQRIKA